MKVKLNIILSLFLLTVVARAQDVGVGASYVFVKELDDVYGGVAHVRMPVAETVFVALRGGIYQDVERTSTISLARVDISADYYPVDLGLGWNKSFGQSGWDFFIEAGVNYGFIASDILINGTPVPLEIEDHLGWYSLIGLAYGKGPWNVFTEAHFRTFDLRIDRGGLPPETPTPAEIDLDHIAFNLGVSYEW